MWKSIRVYGPGLLCTALIGLSAQHAAHYVTAEGFLLSGFTLAIAFGCIVGNTLRPMFETVCGPGIDFAKSRLLQAGVALYGFQITFGEIAGVGWEGILIAAVMLISTFSIAVYLGTQIFKLDRETAILIGAGSSICGAAAVVATGMVVRGTANRISIAVATVIVFGTIAMIAYPRLFPYLNLTEAAYGLYVGSTIHEVSQVMVAGTAVGEKAASVAVIEKMLRVVMLAPFLLLLSYRLQREDGVRTGSGAFIPWFVVFFILASGIHSLQLLPSDLIQIFKQLHIALLTMALSGLGLRTQLAAVRQAGPKPILLGGSLFIFLLIGGYIVNQLVAGIAS